VSQILESAPGTIDAYVMRLKLKIDSCEYDKTGWPAAVKAKMTRDKFAFGLIDDVLKERLLREADLTLECTVSQAQPSESSKAQAKEMSTQAKSTLQCDAVKQLWRSDNKGVLFMCRQCGRQHRPRKCAAYGQQCWACHKLHHFAKMCRSKKFATEPKMSNSHKKNVFTLDDENSDMSDAQESEGLLVDPLKIDGVIEHAAWL